MRKHKQQLQRIDIDELFSSPVNRGMLSFLERPPEEAEERLREKERVNRADSKRLNSHPVGDLHSGTKRRIAAIEGGVNSDEIEPLVTSTNEEESLVGGHAPEGKSQGEQRVTNPGGDFPPGINQSLDVLEVQPDSIGIYGTAGRLIESGDNGVRSPGSDSLAGPHVNYPVGNSHAGVIHHAPSLESNSNKREFSPLGQLPAEATDPVGNLPLAVALPHPLQNTSIDVNRNLAAQEPSVVTHPLGNTPRPPSTRQARQIPRIDQAVTHPLATSPPGQSSPEQDTATLRPGYVIKPSSPRSTQHSPGNLPPGSLRPSIQPLAPQRLDTIDGGILGRRQKVRRAVVAQDGHSSGEQLLYQALWNAARAETAETRLLCIGYSGMSSLCKLDKSNCKKNIQSLTEKLAVEVIQLYQSVSSTGTTYRIYSYKEILRRRESAGLVWVIRTSGVRFVNIPDPVGNSPWHPGGILPMQTLGNSPIPPLRALRMEPLGETRRAPLGETPTHLGRERKDQEKTSSADSLYQALLSYGQIDDDVVNRLLQACKQIAPDSTIDEIIYFVHQKGSLITGRESQIYNPIGFLLTAVPKCFSGEAFTLFRERQLRLKQEESRQALQAATELEAWEQAQNSRLADPETRARLDDPDVPEWEKRAIRDLLGIQ